MKRPYATIIVLLCAITTLTMATSASAVAIAAVMSSDQPRYREAHRAFVKALAAHGYQAPGTEIVLHAPSPAPLSWNTELRKLTGTKPDLIITYGAPASLAAARDSSGVSVVSVDVFAPEQPIKGICGVSSRVSMVTLLKNLKDIKPFQRLGVLTSPRDAGAQHQLDDIRKHATRLGITVLEGNVTSSASLDTELTRLVDKCEAIVVTEGEILSQQFERIIARTTAKRIPVAATMPDAAEKGAIVSLEINPQEQGYLAAEMAVRVLEGAQTQFLPLVRPQRTDLVVNMRRAREIGIDVPFSVQHSATRLIK
jgi:putative ABC transport system substrate-binding protein